MTPPEPQLGVQSTDSVGGRKGEKTLAELAHQSEVHLKMMKQWWSRLLEGAADVFGAEPAIEATVLHARVSELTLANDFLTNALGTIGPLPSAKR